MATAQMKWTGLVPLITHNGQLADPLNEFAKALKKVTSNRKKTDEDHAEIARIEWEGGLYLDDELGPVIPAEAVEAALHGGAKRAKKGKEFKACVRVVEPNVKIAYKGPRDVEAMWASGKFRDSRLVKVGTARVMRCRPKFNEWSLEFGVEFDGINKEDVLRAATDAGRWVGLCELRPRYGRFEAEWA